MREVYLVADYIHDIVSYGGGMYVVIIGAFETFDQARAAVQQYIEGVRREIKFKSLEAERLGFGSDYIEKFIFPYEPESEPNYGQDTITIEKLYYLRENDIQDSSSYGVVRISKLEIGKSHLCPIDGDGYCE